MNNVMMIVMMYEYYITILLICTKFHKSKQTNEIENMILNNSMIHFDAFTLF